MSLKPPSKIKPSPRPSMAAIIGIVISLAVAFGLWFVAKSPKLASNQTGVIRVAAAENFWGSIAAQLGGDQVSVTSIINNPATDPHDYEPTAADSRTMATTQYAIINGIGYDPWASKLVASSQTSAKVLSVGNLLGITPGGNPHRWYSPENVEQVINQITADYQSIDPAHAAYFAQQKATYESVNLKQYNALINEIRTNYAGMPVGASESIFSPLAQSLGLNLLTPTSFLTAMSEGTDPTAADKTITDQQITTGQIKVYVYNSQNSTPDIKRQIDEAKAAGIPVVTVTETLTPAGASFQDWQSTQLQNLRDALAKATRK